MLTPDTAFLPTLDYGPTLRSSPGAGGGSTIGPVTPQTADPRSCVTCARTGTLEGPPGSQPSGSWEAGTDQRGLRRKIPSGGAFFYLRARV